MEALTVKKDSVAAQILALDNDNAAQQKSLEIKEAQLELSTLEAENKAFRDNQLIGSVDVHGLNIRVTSLQAQLNSKKSATENESAYISSLDQQIADSRKRWFAINNEAFSGGTCATCGQTLPADKLQQAMTAFETHKKIRLQEIEQTANANKAAKAQAEDRFTKGIEEVTQLEAEIADVRGQIAAAEAAKVEPKDMADYAQRKDDIQGRIDKLNADLFEIHESVADLKAKLRQEMSELNGQISEKMGIISTQNLLDYSRKRVQELRDDAKNAAECLEAIEKMLYLIDEYSRYKTKFVEDSINGLFRIARFRLFREQANGGIEDRCDVVYDGIPYISVNNGMKINLGIDIINTLSTAYGVRVPLFVDNAESVTNLEKCSSQIVRLVVSENDKELRVNYEN